MGVAGRLGGAEGGGEGAGAGGFCAITSGARNAIAMADNKKMRIRWPIDQCPRKEGLHT